MPVVRASVREGDVEFGLLLCVAPSLRLTLPPLPFDDAPFIGRQDAGVEVGLSCS